MITCVIHHSHCINVWVSIACMVACLFNFKAFFSVRCTIFLNFHTKSHNMKALIILSYSWSPFLKHTCLYGKVNFYGSLCSLLKYFLENKLPSCYLCKSHDHDQQWADFVMAWLPYNKRKCEHNIVKLVFVYILLRTC